VLDNYKSAKVKPIIVINLKTYQQGAKAVNIAKEVERVDRNIILGVQASDIYEISKSTKLKIYAQHVDYYEPGRNTGYILPEAVKKDGAIGTFLNHSEHKLSYDTLKKTIERCKRIKLKTLVFASNLKEAEKIQKLKPDYLAIEPPELVGGKKSVLTEKPELIRKIKSKIKMKFLVGAGVHTHEDILIACKLGAAGIAVSSAITKAKNSEKKLRELIK
jgi:triosephosphate isomerase